LKMLRRQKGVTDLEIIVVDSGSSDQTIDLCCEYGATLYTIPSESFSHSYARNLGAMKSKGTILMFLTQDAVPDSENWIKEMIQPILSGEASAVSCRERCPEGTDLYYKVASWNHSRFIGINEHDVLNTIDEHDTAEILRRKASLNDISCAIASEVFHKFLYRFNYAEDLDMGLRLLKAGHSLKLLSKTEVLHGHRRDEGYYLKRGFVETKALGRISGEWKQPDQPATLVSQQFLLGEKRIHQATTETLTAVGQNCSTEKFVQALCSHIQRAKTRYSFCAELPENSVLQQCRRALAPYETSCENNKHTLLDGCVSYLECGLFPYLYEKRIESVDKNMQHQLCSCVIKQFYLIAGALFATIPESEPLYCQLDSIATGV